MTDSRLIFFHVGGHGFAVPLSEIREIVAVSAVTPVPGARAPLEGVTVYREEGVLPLFSLLGAMGNASITNGALIVVAELGGEFIGFRVEGVGGVIGMPEENGLETYKGELKGPPGAIKGIFKSGGQVLVAISLSGVFQEVLD